MNIAGEGSRNGTVGGQGANVTLMRRPNQKFPVFIHGKTVRRIGQLHPRAHDERPWHGENKVGFE